MLGSSDAVATHGEATRFDEDCGCVEDRDERTSPRWSDRALSLAGARLSTEDEREESEEKACRKNGRQKDLRL